MPTEVTLKVYLDENDAYYLLDKLQQDVKEMYEKYSKHEYENEFEEHQLWNGMTYMNNIIASLKISLDLEDYR